MIQKIRGLLRTRQQAYRQTFYTGDDGQPSIASGRVLEDLARFCHAHESPFLPDERATLIMIGRQEVFARIQHQLNMTDDQLWSFYQKKPPAA